MQSYVMEYHKNETLTSYFHLNKDRLDIKNIVTKLLLQMTDALLYLKSHHNISHRDIKPDNILVDENDNFILTDFGQHKKLQLEETKTSTIRGTPIYLVKIINF